MSADRYDLALHDRTAKARLKLLETHPCSALCGDGEHVDLVYVGGADKHMDTDDQHAATIRRRYEYLHEVEVLDVRLVEAGPPLPGVGLEVLAGYASRDPDAITFGVWWRVPQD